MIFHSLDGIEFSFFLFSFLLFFLFFSFSFSFSAFIPLMRLLFFFFFFFSAFWLGYNHLPTVDTFASLSFLYPPFHTLFIYHHTVKTIASTYLHSYRFPFSCFVLFVFLSNYICKFKILHYRAIHLTF